MQHTHSNLPSLSAATSIYDTERVSNISKSRFNIIYDRRYYLSRGDVNSVRQRIDMNESIEVFLNNDNNNPTVSNSATSVINGHIASFEREIIPIMML